MNHHSEPSEMLNRIRIQILIRLLLIIFSILVLLIRGAEQPKNSPFNPSYILLISVGLLNLGYALILNRIVSLERFVLIQAIIDTAWITGLIYFTGGVLSSFVSFYFFAILTSVIVVRVHVPFLITSFSITGLCFVSLAYFFAEHFQFRLFGVHPFWGSSFGGNLNFIMAYLLAQVISFVLVAWLGSHLMFSLTQVKIVSEEILDSMADGIITFDKFDQLVFINQKARSILGFSPETKILGTSLKTFKQSNEMNALFWNLFERHERLTREIVLHKESSQEIWIKVDISLIFGVKNKMRGIVAVLSDLTLEKQMGRAITLAIKLKGIEELAAGLAHEIRNPLASIRGAVQELQEELPQQHELIQIAIKESNRLNQIITDFVQFAHVTKRVKTVSVSLYSLLKEVQNLLIFQYKNASIEWSLICEPSLSISGDEAQLRQMFLNLLLNAIEAVDFSGKISIRAYYFPSENFLHITPQEGIQIEIEDNGPGLTEEEQKHLFIPFYTTKKGGTGLGLGIVYRIVKAHEGNIKVKSNSGEGTTIIIWLPR